MPGRFSKPVVIPQPPSKSIVILSVAKNRESTFIPQLPPKHIVIPSEARNLL
jgi:hypothetical protein